VSISVVLVLIAWVALKREERPSASAAPEGLLPLHVLRALRPDGGPLRIWAITTDNAQAVELISTKRFEMKEDVGYCYAAPHPGTVPVWHRAYPFRTVGYDQHLYTTATDPAQDDALTWAWTERYPEPICYVHPAPAAGTKPLYRMREGANAQPGAAGDGHGHVLTDNPATYTQYGFVTDQIWYLPVGDDHRGVIPRG
jgi:hypothetical protein